MSKAKSKKLTPADLAAEAVRIALEHLPAHLSTADAMAVARAAVTAAVDAFQNGAPAQKNAAALLASSVKLGLGALPTNLSNELRGALQLVLEAALGWLWQQMQPIKVEVKVDKGAEWTSEIEA